MTQGPSSPASKEANYVCHTVSRYCSTRGDHAFAAGSHPGFCPVHAKGIVCSGTFRGAPAARGVSRPPHLQGQTVPTVIRFSNSSGNPDVHDGVANARALAVKFQSADGKNTDVLGLSVKGFPARTPEDFLAFLRAQLPDPVTGKPRPDAIPRFLESHPATRAFIERLMQKPVPASYGQATYYAEHAFLFLPLGWHQPIRA